MGSCFDISIGKYTVQEKIGSGRQANIFRVKDPDTNKIYALKRYKKYGNQDVGGIKEVENLRRLNSSYVVKIIDAFVDESKSYYNILLENCQTTLNTKLQQIGQQEKRNFQQQLIKGVSYLHSQNLIHRDLKLQNILIKRGRIKIGDFGLSKKLYSNLNTELPYGERQYCSPEYLEKGFYSKAADCWALGMMLLQLQKGIRAHRFRTGNRIPSQSNDFPNEGDLQDIKNLKMKTIIKGLLHRDQKMRMTTRNAEELLGKKSD